MSDVIRYDYLYNEEGELQLAELPIGRFVCHSDYAELEASYNALEARIKNINVWHECDKCGCLFIPGGKGAETTCGKCLKEELNALRARYNALVDAVVHVYNSGYYAGHHDTVEGRYIDIHSSDMASYHAEEVAELLSELEEKCVTKNNTH